VNKSSFTLPSREGEFDIGYRPACFRANQLTCAVRTGEKGFRGISLLVIDSDTPGYSVSEKLEKMGRWASDTAQIFLVDLVTCVNTWWKGCAGITESFLLAVEPGRL